MEDYQLSSEGRERRFDEILMSLRVAFEEIEGLEIGEEKKLSLKNKFIEIYHKGELHGAIIAQEVYEAVHKAFSSGAGDSEEGNS